MKKLFIILAFVLVGIVAQAQENGTTPVEMNSSKGLAAIGAGIAVVGAGLGIGLIGYGAQGAISRQPEAASEIRSNMIVTAALIEGVAFFALVICILVLVL